MVISYPLAEANGNELFDSLPSLLRDGSKYQQLMALA